jgi:LacI family transcriptional regulator
VSDNRRGTAVGVTHLIRHGHRRIGFLGDEPTIWTSEERYQGYVDALAAHALSVDLRIVRRDSEHGEARVQSITAMLSADEPPTALFTGQNLITMDAIRALRAVGRQHDVAMVGFDDFQLADMLEPGVTVIAQDLTGMGHRAAELVFDRIDGDDRPAQLEVVPTRLITRGSGEIRPA